MARPRTSKPGVPKSSVQRQGTAPKYMDPDIQRAILDAIADGNYLDVCAKIAGIHPDTLHDWLRVGRAKEDVPGYTKATPELIAFVEEIDLALAKWEADTVKAINQTARSGAPNTWQAGMTMLERRFPDRWGRRDQVKLEGGDKPLVQLNQVVLVDHEVRANARALLRQAAGWSIEAGRLPLQPADVVQDEDE